MAHIQVILGSNRPGRAGKAVADWLMQTVPPLAPNHTFELVDLLDVDLPFLNEEHLPSSGEYTNQQSKDWANKIAQADGYVWITPEYNHGTSAVLKNAIDFVYKGWNYKPVAFVGYGGMGGARAIEHLVSIASELKMVPLATRLHLVEPWASIQDFKLDPSYIKGNPQAFADELDWWVSALNTARKK